MQTARLRVLGVMTGTSCDGLDAACIAIDPEGWQPLWASSASYPSSLRKKVLAFQSPGSKYPIQDLLDLDRELGDWYGETLAKMVKKSHDRPELIANHGQTVAHHPASHSKGGTLQLGDPTRIVTHTGLTVVSSFREGDMAAGGQGAPLVPLFHKSLAKELGALRTGIAIHNIGGISNLTYIGPGEKILAFDTGPGNMWIDAAAEVLTKGRQKMDIDGKLGASGVPDPKVLAALLKHPYFRKTPPKSTGRDDFTREFFLSKAGKLKTAALAATATAVAVESIAEAYEKFILKKGLPLNTIYVCGGGAENPTLMNGLKARLPQIRILSLSSEGFDGQLIEAQAFAYFGFLSLLGRPLGGAWTGATEFGPPGAISAGPNWLELMKKIQPWF